MGLSFYTLYRKIDPKIGCKMVKNALNKLIFGLDMYFYGIYQFLNGFWEILKIGQFLAENRSFSAFSRRFFFNGRFLKIYKIA